MATGFLEWTLTGALLSGLAAGGVGGSPPLAAGDPALVPVLAPAGPALAGTGRAGTPRRRLPASPHRFVSGERMLAALRELTACGAGRLWRTSGSSGEREAFAWLRAQLQSLDTLEALGMEVVSQGFRLPLSTEVWETRLELQLEGSRHAVPLFAMQGHRENLSRALRFDTDGAAGDAERDPVEVTGPVRVLRTWGEIDALEPGALQGEVALVDYAVFDAGVVLPATARARAAQLLGTSPAAVVLVTSYANRQGEAHGSFVGDTSCFVSIDSPAPVPTAFTRLEDLAAAGVSGWGDLGGVAEATLRLDVDVLSPGRSELVFARLPGVDGSRSVILGAHLDSPNSPGALDNGSGSVALLEAARALDAAGARPPVDTYLVWSGSHERGFYGASTFVLSHQEVLDGALGWLQVDCLGHAAEGLQPRLVLEQWSYGGWGDPSTPLATFVAAAAGERGDALLPLRFDGASSDNTTVVGLDVPNGNLILMDPFGQGEVHVDNHLHDPYDTVELAGLHLGELATMARTCLTAALRLGDEQPDLRVTLPRASRAVFVASHTEQPHMTPVAHTVLGMALAWEGLDVDVVPHGRAVTAADLDGAALVVVLPVLDYGGADSEGDEAWTSGEVAALQAYAAQGGLLVLTASGHRMRQPNTLYEVNEDCMEVNAVAGAVGVAFSERVLPVGSALVTGSHRLVQGVTALTLAQGNGRAVSAPRGRVLATSGTEAAVLLASYGSAGGEVLALGDLAILGHLADRAPNATFWHNLARYALGR